MQSQSGGEELTIWLLIMILKKTWIVVDSREEFNKDYIQTETYLKFSYQLYTVEPTWWK